jgi:hypothetical protein
VGSVAALDPHYQQAVKDQRAERGGVGRRTEALLARL